MTLPTPPERGRMLPILGQDEPEERSDAARNRLLLLETATTMVAEDGAPALTMDRLAQRAGVGKGTVFRRFGSRAGLMLALLDHSEQEFQASYLFGPPPLGPDAEPLDRLIAFGRMRLDLMEIQGELKAAGSGLHYSGSVYLTDLTHIGMLLRRLNAPGDVDLLSHALLNVIDAPLVLHQTTALGIPISRIAANWENMVRRIAAPD